MGTFFLPRVRFVLRGRYHGRPIRAEDPRSRAVLLVLMEYVRCQEWNNVVQIRTIRTTDPDSTVDLIVRPGLKIYENVRPERIPALASRHVREALTD